MTTIVLITFVIWAVTMLIFWLVSNRFKSFDADKFRGRLLGVQKKTKKAQGDEAPALFHAEEQMKGQIAMRVMKKYKLADKTQDLLEQAGVKWKVYQFVHISIICFMATWLTVHFLTPTPFSMAALPLAIGATFLPLAYVIRLKKKRLKEFEEAFPESLEFISRSMRAGHAFSVALEMIHREFQEPLSSEFKRTFEEHNLGLPLEVALQGLSRRVPLLDVHFFVSAVLLQKRTGGNLAEILDKLATIIRERFKLRGRIRAISAHGKMTSIALSCIPAGVAVLMFFSNPGYVTFFFTDDVGQIMLGAAVALQLVGYLIMKKIVNIEV